MLTIHDIMERLKREDEVTILELLEINSTDLVHTFLDRIEDKFDYLESLMKEDDE